MTLHEFLASSLILCERRERFKSENTAYPLEPLQVL